MKAAPGLHQAGIAWAQGSAGVQYSRIHTARRPWSETASHHYCSLLRGEQELYVVFSKDARLCIHKTQKLVFERGDMSVHRHNMHAKALRLSQWLHSISFTNIKNIFPNYWNHFATYAADAESLAWGFQCLTATVRKQWENSAFSTPLPVQYFWLQQAPGHVVPWSFMQGTASEIYIWGIQIHRPSPVQTETCSRFLSNNIPTNFHLTPH